MTGSGTRNTVRWLAACGLAGLGLPRLYGQIRRRSGRWGIILRYHRVIPPEEPWSYYRIGLERAAFETQMEFLASHARVVPLEALLRQRASGRVPREDWVVLTFDDGYRDNYTEAVPILRRLGLPATFFISAACASETMPFWPEVVAQMLRLSRAPVLEATLEGHSLCWPLPHEAEKQAACRRLIALLRPVPLDRIASALEQLGRALLVEPVQAREASPPVLKEEHIRAMAAAGFSIGSHTVNHPYLPSEEPVRQRWELAESRARLESIVRAPVLDFCYPGGGADAVTRRLVQETGYRSAVTTETGIVGVHDDPLQLVRIGVGAALASDQRGRFSASLMRVELSGFLGDLYRGRRQAAARRTQTLSMGAPAQPAREPSGEEVGAPSTD